MWEKRFLVAQLLGMTIQMEIARWFTTGLIVLVC
jgi:hypothetical protein